MYVMVFFLCVGLFISIQISMKLIELMHFNFITGNEIMTFMKFSLLYT